MTDILDKPERSHRLLAHERRQRLLIAAKESGHVFPSSGGDDCMYCFLNLADVIGSKCSFPEVTVQRFWGVFPDGTDGWTYKRGKQYDRNT